MIIVDTSVWIDHIRKPDFRLQDLLNRNRVVQHPMVTAEIALGAIKNRTTAIGLFTRMLSTTVVSDKELLEFIEKTKIHATGLGFVDVNLLATALIEQQSLWTRDKRLKAQAERLGCAFMPA